MTCTYVLESDAGSVETPFECSSGTHEDSEYCLFHMPEAERERRDIPDERVTDRAVRAIADDDCRELIGASIPELPMDYANVESEDQSPTDLRHATIPGGISAKYARFEEILDLRHSTLGGIEADNAAFETGIRCQDATLTGEVVFFEADVHGDDADFTDVSFTAPVTMTQTTFDDDVRFGDATFEDAASFDGTEFHGTSNDLDDNARFSGAVFEKQVSFAHVTLEATEFENVTFEARADFTALTAKGPVSFEKSTFLGQTIFDEASFDDDATFARAVFSGETSFRGVEFYGRATILQEDISFAGATFEESVTFERGRFGLSHFEDAAFHGRATFRRSTFLDDTTFAGASFSDTADFDETVFESDCLFTDVQFDGFVQFRGAEFRGGTNYLADDADFREAVFRADTTFADATFASADFSDTAFKGDADFTGTAFEERLALRATSFGEDTFFDFTDVTIVDGRIEQPADGWVRFDMTRATLGDVELTCESLSDERELLDYFRFCDTTFDGFDFSQHTAYLDRNGWTLHDFDAGNHEGEFTLPMTPEIIEKTYLNAKNCASESSNIKAAGEFRVQRQQYARRKFFGIALDETEPIGTRSRNAVRGLENLFLGVSCGYGLRLYRIAAVFLVLPLFSAVLFALGGPFFETGAGQVALSEVGTPEGLDTLALNIYFSYITFLTVGYGNIGPIGNGARFLAALLVYLNVILAGLFLYALIKRSEI